MMLVADPKEMENEASRRFTGSRFYRLLAPVMGAVLDSPLRRRLNDAERTLDGAGVQVGAQVLEVGCGTGYFTLPAARRIGAGGHLRSIDLSPEAIEAVKRKVAAAGLQNVGCSVADARATGLPDAAFDVILLFGVVPAPVLPLGQLLPEMARVLRRGGRLAIWPAFPLALRPAIGRGGQFAYEGKVKGVFRFRKI